MERVVAVEDCKIAEAENEVLGQVLNGMTFILFPNDTQAINVNLKRWKKVAGVGGAQLFNLGREGFVHGKPRRKPISDSIPDSRPFSEAGNIQNRAAYKNVFAYGVYRRYCK